MPTNADLSTACAALAGGLCLIAAFLGLRQWYERKGREHGASEADDDHYSRQDLRRWAGVIVLLLIAVLAPTAAPAPDRSAARANLPFVLVWSLILVLIMLLLMLALLDWRATRHYARRRRRELLRESIESIRERARQTAGRARDDLDPTETPGSPDHG